MNSRERFSAMLDGRTLDHLVLMPITMMFAADQIGVSYRQYVTDFRVLVDAQVATAGKYDLDYVSCISDPAREAADCGAKVHFFDNQPPGFDEQCSLLADKTKLASLKIPDPLGGGRMHDRVQAAALFKQRVGGEKIIEGWVEGPCAQAADLRGINTLMTDFGDDPAFVNDLMDFVVEMEIRFARAQIEAGADLIGIGDAAASLIGPRLYDQYVQPREKKMVDAIHAMGAKVRLHICGNTRRLLEGMGKLGCEIVDLDLAPLAEGRAKMGAQQILCGNINPVQVLRNGTPEIIQMAIAECHQQARPRYVVGAGCEVPRDTPHDNMMALTHYALGHQP